MFVLLPVPHEATTSYGKGTKNGPAAILKALTQVEEYDQELGIEVSPGRDYVTAKSLGTKASPRVVGQSGSARGGLIGTNGLGAKVKELLNDKKIPVILGGEHSLSVHAVKACKEKYKDLSVLQLDAHADLRDTYHGRKDSHACVMRRILEVCPAVQAGIRSISQEEWEWANKTGQAKKIHFAEKLELVDKIESQLSKNVYITIDVDVFDPSIIPSTGTPEPGGLFWYEVLDILQRVCRDKHVVAFDVVELAPRKGDIASDFTVAKLVWKMMGYLLWK